MYYKLETMTPAKAKKLLDRNTRNRRIRGNWVNRLVHIIESGRWVIHHQGIAISPEGEIVDGQHRLLAIVKANKAVKINVCYNVPSDAVMGMDQGILRNVPDIAGPLYGFDHRLSNHQVAIARQMATSVGAVGTSSLVTNEEVLRFTLQYLEAINFSAEIIKAKSFQHACIRAPVARAWYSQDRDRLMQFGEVINSGMALGDADRAAITFRNWFLENKALFGGGGGRTTLYRKCETALRAFLRKRSLIKLAENTEELFPLPDEMNEETDGNSSPVLPLPRNDSGGVQRPSKQHGQAWAARSDRDSSRPDR